MLDTLLVDVIDGAVTVIDCTLEDFPLLDIIPMLVTDDVDINAVPDTKPITDGKEVCSLLDNTLVGTTIVVELISLLAVLIAEAAVCEELNSLFDTALVDVIEAVSVLFDSLLGVDIGLLLEKELIEVMDEVVVSLLVDAAIEDIKYLAVVKVVDIEETCSLLDNTLLYVTDGIDVTPLLDTS